MLTSMNTRLKQFLAAENLTQAQLADNLKVVRASISHILSGRNNPGYDFIKVMMQKYPKLNMEWLILGKGKMYKESPADVLLPFEEEVETIPIETEGHAADPTPITLDQNPPNTPSNTSPQRQIKKIIVFFDDNSYQEL